MTGLPPSKRAPYLEEMKAKIEAGDQNVFLPSQNGQAAVTVEYVHEAGDDAPFDKDRHTRSEALRAAVDWTARSERMNTRTLVEIAREFEAYLNGVLPVVVEHGEG